MRIHDAVMKQSVKTVPWYRKDQRNEPLTLPVLGPDLYNPKDREALMKIVDEAGVDKG